MTAIRIQQLAVLLLGALAAAMWTLEGDFAGAITDTVVGGGFTS